MEDFSKEHMQMAIEAAGIGLWFWDLKKDELSWTEQCKALFGVPANTLMTYARFLAAVHPEDRAATDQAVKKSLRERGDYRIELRSLRPDGTIRSLVSRGRTICDAAGEPTSMMGIAADITDRKLAEQQLHQSAERLRLAQSNTGVGIFDWDLQTQFLYASPELEALYGLRPGGMRCIEDFRRRVHPDDLARTDQRRDTAIQRHEQINEEFRIVRPHGEERWILCRANTIYNGAGQPVRVVGSNLDITERKCAELRLRESEARFRLAIDGSPIAVFTCDKDLRFTWVYNPQPPITDPDQYIGRRVDQILSGEPAGRALAITKQRVLESGVSVRSEFIADLRSGIVHYDYALQPIRDEAGEVVGVCGTAMDITRLKRTEDERDRAQAELEATIEELQTVLDIAQIQIWRGDATCEKFIGNRLAYEQHGLPLGVNASFDAPISELPEGYHVEVNGRVLDSTEMPMQIAAQTGKPVHHFEHDVVHADGRRMTMWANVAPLLNPDGSVRSVIGAYLDITELRKAERTLREADRKKEEFIAILAHELRNPLGSISSAAESLNLKLMSQDGAQLQLGIIKRQVSHMVRMIDDLLDVSRLNYGRLSLRKEKVDLADVIRSAIETSQPIVNGYRHQLQMTVSGQTIWLDADPIRLAQVISNLINNAAKFMPLPGEIHLTYRLESDHVVISVRDNGIGTDMNGSGSLFKPFAQSGPASIGQAGLGIGLALARGLVALHGGTIDVNSDGAGKGSEFLVSLPLSVQNGVKADALNDRTKNVAAERCKRILIVDDLADNADAMALLLESMGHETRSANSGPDALVIAAEFNPEVILLDLGMPDMDGLETCRRIRQQAWGKDIAVVALSGWGREEDRHRTKAAGFDHHITKPVSATALADLLHR